MDKLFFIINKPLSILLKWLMGLFGGNFAIAVFLFTLVANLVLIPLSIKSQKSTVQQTRIKPKLDELKKRYGDDKQKYNQAMQQLYSEEGVSMSGGCLPMVLRLIFMMSIFYLLTRPLTYLVNGVDATAISNMIKTFGLKKAASELQIIKELIKAPKAFPEITSQLKRIDFTLFGLDLTATPKFSFDVFHDAEVLWLMPVVAFLAQLLTSALTLVVNKKTNPDAPSMAGMMLTMPLLTLFIGFGLPGGVTFYWICSSIIGGAIQLIIQTLYGPHRMLSRERIKELSKQCDFENKKYKVSDSAVLNGDAEK